MKNVIIITVLSIHAICLQVCFAQQISPRQQYPGLFEAIQLNNVFPDNKTFVDETPKYEASEIMKAYNLNKSKAGFKLKAFVDSTFILPGQQNIIFKTDLKAGIRKHIDTLWQVLSRHHDTISTSSLLPLKYDYIIPGGRFREIYYWDSYFTMLGLQESKKTSIIENMIRNFSDLIDRYGFIPNGTRAYYLTRSQPPFFSVMLDLLAKDKGDTVFVHFQKEMLDEYHFWMKGSDSLKQNNAYRRLVRMPDNSMMNRYYDNSDQPREESYKQDVNSVSVTTQKPQDYYRNIRAAAESGWDFSTRWFDPSAGLESIHTTDLIPVDLNCLLYHLENSIAKSYKIQGNHTEFERFDSLAGIRKNAILKYCWSEKLGWFMDYNFRKHQQTDVETLAGTYPMEFSIATKSQASRIALNLTTKFLMPGGLVTTLNRSGQQWDSPNGWAPLQYIAIDGLEKYKFSPLARLIAQRWIKLNIQVFEQTGKLVEKYNVIDTHLKAGGGEYSLQDGFGWTNGVLLHLMNRYPLTTL